MDSKKKISISWSGGKDSALALYRIQSLQEFEIVNLHTVFDSETRRVGLHGISEELVELQSKLIGIPLVKIYLKSSENTTEYEKTMTAVYRGFLHQGISHILFGDIFLADLRSYRESLLKGLELEPVFPLWHVPALNLVDEFLKVGFKTLICACNEKCYQAKLLGETLTTTPLNRFPDQVDLCGENGEFHTFVFDGPVFRGPVAFALGKTVSKEYYYKVVDDQGAFVNRASRFYFKEVLSS